MTVYIIAEAGVNHNGSQELAMKLIDVAVESGANAVKFQTFRAELLCQQGTEKAEYQKSGSSSSETQFEMLKQLELSETQFVELSVYAKSRGIDFLSTAFDSISLKYIVENLDTRYLKISSGEITNLPFILEHAMTAKPLIVSTGMASSDEIRDALAVISYAELKDELKLGAPGFENFYKAFEAPQARQKLNQRVTLLHCTSAYPAPFSELNLSAMREMESEFGVRTGYSDHSQGIAVPIAATALGAVILEKHFTLDKALPGPDHSSSLEPEELKEMVRAMRSITLAIGDGKKIPTDSELRNRQLVRKSLYAITDIQKGERFSSTNIATLRPEGGLPPSRIFDLLGKKSSKNIKSGQKLVE